MPSDQERKKWDQYYASHHQDQEPENIRQFREEFVGLVEGLLPEGGRVLEAGSGAGQQSLSLAQKGTFEIALMDFSTEAIDLARGSFARSGLEAHFDVQDVFQPGEPEFDLVFNAGVLEHYDFDEQVDFMRGMASRSRKFVLVLVPNFQNYWYWVWRIQKSSQGSWPFGKEIPALDMARVFGAVDLHYHGSAYLGVSWTESFIDAMDGISDELRRLLLDIHGSGLLAKTQTSYLLAGLGSVEEIAVPQAWQGQASDYTQISMPNLEAVSASLADALAIKVGDERDAQQLRAEFNTQMAAIRAQLEQIQQSNILDLVERVREIEVKSADILESKIRDIEREQGAIFAQRLQDLEQRQARELAEFIQQIEREKDNTLLEKLAALEHQFDE